VTSLNCQIHIPITNHSDLVESLKHVNTWFNTVNREIFAALKVGEFAFFQLAVDKIPHLLLKFNG
jgi:hypothetical protein